MADLFSCYFKHIIDPMVPKEPAHKRHGRERHREGPIREKAKVKSDMILEPARRMRMEKRAGAGSRVAMLSMFAKEVGGKRQS